MKARETLLKSIPKAPFKFDLQLFGSNQEAIEKGVITLEGKTHGLFPKDEAEKFLVKMFDDSSFLEKMNWQQKSSTSGEIDTLDLDERLLRGAIENTDNVTGEEIEPIIGNIEFQTNHMVLGFSMTERWLRENREKENFEELFISMALKRIRNDILDGAFNWDKATPSTDPHYKFLKLDDGFIKQAKTMGGHIIDVGTSYGGVYSDDMFLDAIETLPEKYFDPSKYVWIANSSEQTKFKKYLKKRNTTAGDLAILSGNKLNPQEIPWEILPKFPKNKIMLIDPALLHLIFTYEIRLRSTNEGKEAVYSEKRFYAVHFDLDTLLINPDACVLLENIPKV